jgi:hypothetical protein
MYCQHLIGKKRNGVNMILFNTNLTASVENNGTCPKVRAGSSIHPKRSKEIHIPFQERPQQASNPTD